MIKEEFDREYYREKVRERLRKAQEDRFRKMYGKWSVYASLGLCAILIIFVFIFLFISNDLWQTILDLTQG